MAGMEVHDVEYNEQYMLSVGEEGAPNVGDRLGIETTPGNWLDFIVESRKFNYGGADLHSAFVCLDCRQIVKV